MAKVRFAERLASLFGSGFSLGAVGSAFFDDLADSLVEGDVGAADAFDLVEKLRTACGSDRLGDEASIRQKLAEMLKADLDSAGNGGEEKVPSGLDVLLLLGVNGVGKTTTAAKLAHRYATVLGRKPLLAAADTFRAAAVEQLKIHGERLGIQVVAHKSGGDPAAVVYDAIEAASARECSPIIADTAGRMHTKAGLVEELKKIDRIVEAKATGARYRKFLVLDITTGRNAFAQAETFSQAIRLDGVVLTKYDSSARGGVAFSVAAKLGIPVVYVCDGEGYDDLTPFDADAYVKDFVGLA